MAKDISKKIKKVLRKLRFEVRRLPQKERRSRHSAAKLPPLIDAPLEALGHFQMGNKVAFNCPLKHTVKLNGLSYGPTKWHPFVEIIKVYMAGNHTTYEGSILEVYYQKHQPENADEAVVGFDHIPAGFKNFLAHVYWLSPLRSETI